MRADFEPCVRVVLVAVEDVAERFHAIPADACLIIGGDYDVRPAVPVGNRLERLDEPRPRTGDAHHRVIGFCIIKVIVAAPLRKERTVPVGRDVAASCTHCMKQSI